MQLKSWLKKLKPSRAKIKKLPETLKYWSAGLLLNRGKKMELHSEHQRIDFTFLESLARKLSDHCGHQEYHQLQLTWTSDIWKIAPKYFPSNLDRCLDIGAFTGINSIALSTFAREVIALDQTPHLPHWVSPNIQFLEADIDSVTWEEKIPRGPYSVCFMVEVLEHLMWSPIPFLKWLNQNVDLLIITTPDDQEWDPLTIHPWSRYVHFRYIQPPFPGCPGNPDPMFHVKQYKQHEFVELLSECDFRVLELSRIGIRGHQLVAVCKPRRLGFTY